MRRRSALDSRIQRASGQAASSLPEHAALKMQMGNTDGGDAKPSFDARRRD